MQIVIISIGAIIVLGLIAAVASLLDKGDDTVNYEGHDCSTCSAAADESCKLHCLMEQREQNAER